MLGWLTAGEWGFMYMIWEEREVEREEGGVYGARRLGNCGP